MHTRRTRLVRTAAAASLITGAILITAPSATAAAGCSYDGPTKILSLFYSGGDDESNTIEREAGGNKIVFNGSPCGTATVKNTNTIYLTTDVGAQRFTIDLSNGPFAPGATPEFSGASEIEFIVDLAQGTDAFTVQGGGAAEKVGFNGNTVKLNGDTDADVSLSSVDTLAAYGSGGNDALTATKNTQRVQFYGGGGNDTLSGGGRADTLNGDAGDDTIKGNDGGDNMDGGGNDDTFSGGPGDDYAYGGGGNDTFSGGYGDDSFYAEAGADGNDTFLGGPGFYDDFSYTSRTARVVADLDGAADDGASGEHDRIGTDVEEIEGGGGNDLLTGNDVDNYLYGGDGNDTLKGNDGGDSLYGGIGDDTFHGGPGDDGIGGGDGNDTVFGDAGDDGFYSESAIDGNDEFRGGTGIDQVNYYNRTNKVWIWFAFSNGGELGESDTIGNDIENATGGAGNDDIRGNGLDNTLYGYGGNDLIYGSSGADGISGDAGNDVLYGDDGYDRVYGAAGADTLHLTDNAYDYADCGADVDVATDRDAEDTSYTGCESF